MPDRAVPCLGLSANQNKVWALLGFSPDRNEEKKSSRNSFPTGTKLVVRHWSNRHFLRARGHRARTPLDVTIRPLTLGMVSAERNSPMMLTQGCVAVGSQVSGRPGRGMIKIERGQAADHQ